MITKNRQALYFAISLAALAGFVDALGFIKLGGFFISFMSGNSTRFAVNFSDYDLGPVFLPLAIICLFVLGVIIGTFIQHYFGGRKSVAVLVLISALLFGAASAVTFGMDPLAIAFMVLAMGAENMVLAKKGDVQIGVTYMTGTLVKLGQRFAGILLGEPKNAWVPYLLLWLALVAGAMLGALSYALIGLSSLWVAAFFSLVILNGAHIFQKE